MRETFKENHSISSGVVHVLNKISKYLYINEMNISLHEKEFWKVYLFYFSKM